MMRKRNVRLTVLALALLAAFGAARAQSSTAEGSVDIGLGLTSGDSAERALFGQYNGLRTHGAVGLFGVEYSRRNDETGTSTRFAGVNLLGETRELDFRWKRQGDWTFSAAYGEQVRHDPNTASSGADLTIKRTNLGLGFSKIINPRLQFDVTLSSENKDGSRLFGIGMSCPSAVAPGCRGTTGTETGWALLMLPEPINANHSQVEARLSYAGEKLRLSAGYYGSFYRNAYGSLDPNVPASLNNPLGSPLPLSTGLQAILSQPIALPPDNQAHHLDVAGTYALTRTTQVNFKLGYAQALQHQDFAASGLTGAPAGVSDLGGRVDTTLAQLGISSRPMPKLSLLAKLRYEDRDDRTPIALYNVEGTSTYANRQLSSTKLRGQLQASYQFSSDYRGTLGAEHESIDRGVFTPTSAVAGISALRQKTDETTVRAELRRRMSENFSGSISLASSRRDGSNWLRDNSGLGVTEVADPSDPAAGFATAIFMPTLADRQRDTAKLLADWQASEKLSLQLSAQSGRDRFTTPSAYGMRRAGMDQVNFDATYAWSEAWSANGYVSYGTEALRQSRPGAAILSFDNTSTGVGLGFSGKPNARLTVGGGVSFINDRSVYAQALDASADAASAALLAATGGLPDIVFRQTTVKLFGRYELNKRSELQLDLVHQRSTWTDWAWVYNGVPFSYSDGTTINQQPRQRVTFLGLRYVYHWQ
ncbi:MtrB/PioB family decaheme-associated outer membrane protein [Piscinibacter sp.]|jgi:MtrB/PioB family decaheme-associated outer membrane protein|uniref:MtrB/PioB family decaheme-associated outer membrane protein n=1 Tax=Piscinibacter sp. TaxID=1903157 RepID=UPI002F410CD8